MCRYNQLWGCILLAFGLGVMIGLLIEGGFFAYCFGVGIVLIGSGIAVRK